ncbi:MAG: Rieske 2Fe-2S domain-containing protein [Chloroflexi bacterium]|nr:Rieske 2Fe-2S domain-containing protein [Chloroflexota bacterium]
MADTQRKQGLFHPGDGLAAEAVGGVRVVGEGTGQPGARGVSRRLVFRWLGWGTILGLLAQWTLGIVLGFFWPKKVGAFGGIVNVGSVADFQVGDVRVVREGKFYLSRVPEGFVALWWKCPHLGCTVPWKPDDKSEDSMGNGKGRFNCPCHGSIYDRYGQIITGPAPRPMDLFPVEVKDGKILVSTGPSKAVQRAQALHGPPHVTPA